MAFTYLPQKPVKTKDPRQKSAKRKQKGEIQHEKEEGEGEGVELNEDKNEKFSEDIDEGLDSDAAHRPVRYTMPSPLLQSAGIY